MLHEHGFGNDGTDATKPCQSDESYDHMKEQDEDVAQRGMVSLRKFPEFWPGSVIRHGQVGGIGWNPSPEWPGLSEGHALPDRGVLWLEWSTQPGTEIARRRYCQKDGRTGKTD